MSEYPTLEEIENAISSVYQEAAVRAPGVTMNHEAEPLRGLWAMADAYYEKEGE